MAGESTSHGSSTGSESGSDSATPSVRKTRLSSRQKSAARMAAGNAARLAKGSSRDEAVESASEAGGTSTKAMRASVPTLEDDVNATPRAAKGKARAASMTAGPTTASSTSSYVSRKMVMYSPSPSQFPAALNVAATTPPVPTFPLDAPHVKSNGWSRYNPVRD